MFRRVDQVQNALHDIDDGSIVRIESGLDLAFERCQLAGELAGIGECGSHFREGAHHKQTHLHRSFAVEHIGRHKRAVFGKGAGQILAMLPAL